MSRAYKILNKDGIYFISFATVNWIDVFTKNEYRDIVIESLSYCQKEKGLVLHAWCIMTNHIHLIISAKEGYDLADIIRDMKKYTSKQLIKVIRENPKESRKKWMLDIFHKAGEYNSNNKYYQFWRQDNRPIEIYSNTVIDQKLNYLHNNPVKAGFVENPEDYVYSSAKDYAGEKGLLDIEFL